MSSTRKRELGTASGDALGLTAMRCYQTLQYLERAYHRQLDQALHGFELNVFDSMLLMECCASQTGEMAQAQLAATLGVSAAKISLRLEDLRQRGFLQPLRASADRRRQVWRASSTGKQLIRQLEHRLQSFVFPQDVQSVITVLANSLGETDTATDRSGRQSPRDESRAA